MKKILSSAALLFVAASIFGGYYYFGIDNLEETTLEQGRLPEGETEEAEASDPDSAKRWLNDAWRNSNGVLEVGGLENAVAQREAYLAAHANTENDGFGNNGVANMNWLPIGPYNVGGRTRPVVIDRFNSSRYSIWTGTASGGVWMSHTDGNSWIAMNSKLQNFAVNCLVAERGSGRNPTLWAGTGDGRDGDGYAGGGLFKSTNGGMSWQRIDETYLEYQMYYFDSLAIIEGYRNPNTNQYETVLLAGVNGPRPRYRGLLRSTDGGVTWDQVYEAKSATSIVVDPSSCAVPNGPCKVVANVFRPGTNPNYANINRVVFSDDGGQTWDTATREIAGSAANPPQPLPPSFEADSGRVVRLAHSGGNPNIVYANDGELFTTSQISKSEDWGHSFTTHGLGGINHFAEYPSLLWVSPTNPNLLITGGVLLFRSSNEGSTGSFTEIGGGQLWEQFPHADSQRAANDPRYPNRVYATNDGGINRAEDITTADENDGWENLNRGYQTTQFFSAVGEANGVIVGGTQDNGSIRLISGNKTGVHLATGDGGYSAVDGN